MYEDMDKVNEDIDRMKARFIESGPKFTGRIEIF